MDNTDLGVSNHEEHDGVVKERLCARPSFSVRQKGLRHLGTVASYAYQQAYTLRDGGGRRSCWKPGSGTRGGPCGASVACEANTGGGRHCALTPSRTARQDREACRWDNVSLTLTPFDRPHD
jgi:hypothetical protein